MPCSLNKFLITLAFASATWTLPVSAQKADFELMECYHQHRDLLAAVILSDADFSNRFPSQNLWTPNSSKTFDACRELLLKSALQEDGPTGEEFLQRRLKKLDPGHQKKKPAGKGGFFEVHDSTTKN